jgi:hypothetical protein
VDVAYLGDSITDAWDNEGYGGLFPGRGLEVGGWR